MTETRLSEEELEALAKDHEPEGLPSGRQYCSLCANETTAQYPCPTARLIAENRQLRANVETLLGTCDNLDRARNISEAENRQLREALEEYGGHIPWCQWLGPSEDPSKKRVCNCGWRAALGEKP